MIEQTPNPHWVLDACCSEAEIPTSAGMRVRSVL